MRSKEIYQTYLPLVKSIACKYKEKGVPFEDLIQEGFLGLLEAKEKFDPSRKVKFSTYAYYWIKKKIIEAVQREKIQSLNCVELNEAFLENHAAQEAYEDKKVDIFSFEDLSPLEQKVLKLHFQEGKALSHIARELGIRREKVRQAKQLLLRRVKSVLQNLRR